jgi:formate/nitrite transporter FocA (FNT family)
VKGIAANWLVCLEFYGDTRRRTLGKSKAIWIPLMIFFVMVFEHLSPIMFFIPAAYKIVEPISPWPGFFSKKSVSRTLGKIVGLHGYWSERSMGTVPRQTAKQISKN